MNKILIVSPHFPPSNLAAVHRSRLFAKHLPSFGWEPIIVTVDEKYYEEKPDYNLVKLLPDNLRIEKVQAFSITKPRLIGDIGLRAFFQLTGKVLQLIKQEKIDFLYIPIPSFYAALIGRIAHARTGVKYGIDYIDPWVHTFPGSEKLFSRHWWSTKIARFLEPIALKKAKLITGVAAAYYEGVILRNPHLKTHTVFAAMPYGGEIEDHQQLNQLNIKPYLFYKKSNKIQLVYAGAMLPKSFSLLEQVFKVMKEQKHLFANIEIHFIGTGKTAVNPNSYNIKPYAEKHGLWQRQIFEYPERIPYLDVLVHLQSSSGVFILGSSEVHYTPSKVYQAILSGKPIWAILHQQSSACSVIRNTKAGVVLAFNGPNDLDKIYNTCAASFSTFSLFANQFNPGEINSNYLKQYSAKEVTKILAEALNKTF